MIPSLREYGDWNLSTSAITTISTFGLVGMTIGALVIGTLTDVIGRRRALIYAVAAFSVLTLLCAVAPNPFVFGLLRFLAGVGLGGALPTALALVNEFSKKQGGGSASTMLMTGYHVGAVATAALALVLIDPFGWHSMFVVGAAPAVVLIPLMIKYLPESPSYLLSKGRREEAARPSRHSTDSRSRQPRPPTPPWPRPPTPSRRSSHESSCATASPSG